MMIYQSKTYCFQIIIAGKKRLWKEGRQTLFYDKGKCLFWRYLLGDKVVCAWCFWKHTHIYLEFPQRNIRFKYISCWHICKLLIISLSVGSQQEGLGKLEQPRWWSTKVVNQNQMGNGIPWLLLCAFLFDIYRENSYAASVERGKVNLSLQYFLYFLPRSSFVSFAQI